MPTYDGNQQTGELTKIGAGGVSTTGPLSGATLAITDAVTASTATAGSVVLGDAVGFVEISLNGATVKIPYYNP
jgi:ABC-type Fe2+-enterobactin transport system substrate-binding protein